MTAAIGAIGTSLAANPAVLFQAGSAIMKMQSARAEARGLAAQAQQTRLETRSEVLKYKQQGVAVLDRMLRNEATIMARAGAGSIDPFSGSAMALRFANEAKGAGEFFLTQEGATIVSAMGEAQAGQYMSQARSTMTAATLGGFLGLGMKGYEVNKLGSEATLQPFAVV